MLRIHKTSLLALVLLSGCVQGGAMYYQMFGPPAVPAVYELPKKTTLVMVENYRQPNDTADADLIARQITDDLKENKTAPVVDQDKLVLLRDSEPDKFHSLNIAAVGKAVGAVQIIYVDLLDSAVKQDESLSAIEGKASARIRVIDVASGETRWPLDNQQGFILTATIPYTRSDPDRASEMHASLLDKLSTSIGRLFHSWKPDSDADIQPDQS